MVNCIGEAVCMLFFLMPRLIRLQFLLARLTRVLATPPAGRLLGSHSAGSPRIRRQLRLGLGQCPSTVALMSSAS